MWRITLSLSWLRRDFGGDGPGESRLSVCEPELRRFLLLPPPLRALSPDVLSHIGLWVASVSDLDTAVDCKQQIYNNNFFFKVHHTLEELEKQCLWHHVTRHELTSVIFWWSCSQGNPSFSKHDFCSKFFTLWKNLKGRFLSASVVAPFVTRHELTSKCH